MPPSDPRLLRATEGGSTADELLDRMLRHQAYLVRFSSHASRQLIRTLERETIPDLQAQLIARVSAIQARGYDTGPATTARLREMKATLEGILRAGLAKAKGELVPQLRDLAEHESAWQANRLTEALPIAWDVRTIPSATLRTLVSGTPVRGAVLEDWFGRMERGIPERVVSELSIGMQEGQTLQQLMRRVSPVLDATSSGVEATVRTFVSGISAQTREATFNENDDLIEGVEWVATLDDRTCIVCASRDGQVYPLNEGPRPPAHPNCSRCGIVPRLKSLSELAKAAGFRVRELPEGTRAALNNPVPASTTYEKWLRAQPRWLQNDVLGPTRADAWRKGGGLSLSDMVDALTGRPLTLAELAEREGIALN